MVGDKVIRTRSYDGTGFASIVADKTWLGPIPTSLYVLAPAMINKCAYGVSVSILYFGIIVSKCST